ncbi:MAG: efflux RND transporter periplasmic adaptor subunit [Cyanobacteria bacterium P01_G01_bin.39]
MLFKLKPYLRISASAIGITVLSLGLIACGGKESAQKPSAIAVQLKTLESNTLIDSSEYVGILEARERVSLAPRTEGRIVQIFAQQGDRVSQGQAIVELEPTQEQEDVNAATQNVNVEKSTLAQRQAELSAAEADRAAAAAEVESARADVEDADGAAKLAKINLDRSQRLVEGGALAQQELDNDRTEYGGATAQLNSRRETLNASIKSLQAAQKRVEQARANVNSQEAIIKRAEAELGSISQSLAFNTINAPIEGVVGSFDDKKVGDYVSVGEQMTTITNNQNLELNINIPVEYRDRLKSGLVVETIPEAGGSPIAGEISYIAPLVNSNTQSILTKVSFPNDGNLKDREYLSVRVIWDEKPGILVPTTAVSTLGGQNFVYVASEQQPDEANNQDSSSQSEESSSGLIAEQRPVKLGRIQDQSYQIISGLKEGDEIAVSNILSLRNGTEIKPAQEEAASNRSTEAAQQLEL